MDKWKMIIDHIFKFRVGDTDEKGGCTFIGGEWKDVSTSDLFKGKKVVIFSLPGAFTPTCSGQQLPSYDEMYSQFKDKGIDYIFCVSVNDPYVMNAWGKDNDAGDKITMIADPYLDFTKAIGAEVDKGEKGLGIRSNRYTMFIDDMKVIKLQEEKDTGSCEISAAENFFKLI